MSTVELTEAINSMFLYYSHPNACYACLSDVPYSRRPRMFACPPARGSSRRAGGTVNAAGARRAEDRALRDPGLDGP